MSMRRCLRAAVLVLCLISACGDEDPATATALVVNVKSDMADRVSSVLVRVYKSSAELPRDKDAQLKELSSTDLNKSLIFYKGADDDVLLWVRGMSNAGLVLVEYTTRARFEDGKSVQVPIYLGQACMNNACALVPNQTCFGEANGSLCPGKCGPITLSVARMPIVNPGDEAQWTPRACTMEAGSPPMDLGDAGVDAGDAGDAALDAGVDAGAACTNLVAGNTCSLAPQCGCKASEGCYPLDTSNYNMPVFGCDVAGQGIDGSKCSKSTDCARGYACTGFDAAGYTCGRLCSVDSDCGGQGICNQIGDGKGNFIKGYGTCDTRCATNADCVNTGCCLGAGSSDAYCGPSLLCMKTCKFDEWKSGCTSSTDCCPADDEAVLHCATPNANDAGVSSKLCVPPSCTTSSQCGTGRCCVSNRIVGNVCYDLATIRENLPDGGLLSDYCL